MLRLVLSLCCLVLLLSGCNTVKPRATTLSATVVPANGPALETLSSSVTLSFRTAEKHMSGRGVMLYHRPDQLRLVLLSPFGTTLMEALINGQELTLSYPGNGVAYQGLVSQLPRAAGQQPWRLLQWVLSHEPPPGAPSQGSFTHTNGFGSEETVTLEHGLVVEKSLKHGELVRYRNYQQLQGVWIATELLMEGADGERIKVTLEDPEVNSDLGEQAFVPRLAGLKLLPLSELKAQ